MGIQRYIKIRLLFGASEETIKSKRRYLNALQISKNGHKIYIKFSLQGGNKSVDGF